MTIVKVILKKLIAAVINLNIYYGQYLAILFGKYIKNVRISKSKNERKALLIYITLPFKNINLNSHPNLQEARVIADVLCDLGFSVDVMDYRNNFYVDVKKYYLVIGFGDFYERTFFEKCNALKVHYGTGAPINMQNFAEVNRIKALAEKGINLTPVRLIDRSWPASEILSDAIISVTEGWACNMYKTRHKIVYSVPITYLQAKERYIFKASRKRKNNFIWFGGFGGVHKGLDLCLEVFKNQKNLTLHVCGLSPDKESDFIKQYEDLLSATNIHWHGRLDIDDATKIIDLCQFTILPSCSEGCATSVLTTMARGCIPIVTEQTGIEFPEKIVIEDLSIESVYKAVILANLMSSMELDVLSTKSEDWCKAKHNVDTFKSQMNSALSQIIG